MVHQALGPAETVLNVGAGAGSYEPEGCRVVAVEPSEEMVAQRPTHLGPAIRAVAGALPLGRPLRGRARWPWSPSTSGRTRWMGWPRCAG